MLARLETIAYVSRCRIEDRLVAKEIDGIVQASVCNNQRYGVTGALLFSGCHFMQVLEGPEERLLVLMRKIAEDRRHSDMIVIAHYEIAERRYPEWSMRYMGVTAFAAAFFSRLHHGISADADLQVVHALLERLAA